jgi:aryl-alcohol dehydrogenase-like predicted oxidoreductase
MIPIESIMSSATYREESHGSSNESVSSAPKAERTSLPKTGLEISRVGLGLANMHEMPHASDRKLLIHQALDLGITHFDTSRFYSDGFSEMQLGKILPKNKSGLTIATKFGLVPTPFFGAFGSAAWALRKGRSVLKRLGLLTYPQRNYHPAYMQKSLHASLRALKADYIDIYLLHEPLPDSAITDDLLAALENEKARGTIKFIGVSGAFIDSVVSRFGSNLDVIQSAESTWSESRFLPDITHSLFSDVIRQKLGDSPSGFIRPLLEQALARRRRGAVIVQTRRPAHLKQIVEWARGH